jgi:hypothetical protein
VSAKEDHDLFSQVAEMLGLDEEEGGNFINSAMQRRGHKAVTSWQDGEGEGGGGGDFFSARKNREQRKVGGQQQSGGGKGWQYSA